MRALRCGSTRKTARSAPRCDQETTISQTAPVREPDLSSLWVQGVGLGIQPPIHVQLLKASAPQGKAVLLTFGFQELLGEWRAVVGHLSFTANGDNLAFMTHPAHSFNAPKAGQRAPDHNDPLSDVHCSLVP